MLVPLWLNLVWWNYMHISFPHRARNETTKPIPWLLMPHVYNGYSRIRGHIVLLPSHSLFISFLPTIAFRSNEIYSDQHKECTTFRSSWFRKRVFKMPVTDNESLRVKDIGFCRRLVYWCHKTISVSDNMLHIPEISLVSIDFID